MRAGPLSDSKAIDLLNRYFVPVTMANEAADPSGERGRIIGEFAEKKMGIGDVHVYVIGPDRAAIGGLDIGSALDNGKHLAFLSGIVDRLHTTPGAPAFAPHPQSAPPRVEPGAPAIHLVSRKLTDNKTWNEFPSENWLMLSREEWDRILPPAGAALHATWQIPQPVAVKLAEWIYPQTEETHAANRSRVELADFRLTLVALDGSLGRARIDAQVRLTHSFYPGRPSNETASSQLAGFADFDVTERRVQRLRIVTRKAEYQGLPFGCSLVSVSRETIEAQR